MTFNRIAILGTGAVGGYYGAQLIRAGHDVHFLGRSDVAALRSHGLRIDLPKDAGFSVPEVKAFAAAEDIGPVDLVIVALKTTANGALPRLLPPLLHERTLVVNIQNGLGVDEAVTAIAGRERCAGGLCFINSTRVAPGHIRCSMPGLIQFAEIEGPAGERSQSLAAMFSSAGVKSGAVDSLTTLRWRKLVWNVPFNGLCIVGGGITVADVLASESLTREARALMQEVTAAGRAEGADIPDDFADKQFASSANMGAYRPSSAVDYAEHRPVEVETLWTETLRRAQQRGVPAPRLSLLQALVEQLCTSRP